ncbi:MULTISPECIES: cellulose biosynthesis cyclic di-GMP-binding regulatory protein BcsB [unclassified Cupriavidus]|uniref:cellulose biosynthesis cyclic di-GMP-binding regulatory protein BcsB n=1 Tax=unclassified Cupriavidus TaxID=2640874 RepID=UPI001C004199|nr:MULTISPECIES: cellulose biosynthesis cyclic di-GMP-binding regulatory protein BcsB [unclassified Cupriavidus]MCA3194241.1 cellulose biosynthesis cyclic di-GMP-binding regulatory protein BcsB [Cupriavidus sp.]MCA3198121.1 cellulose biosynthesis cyclic di-GMP-binding regulatory protein BcsB [Cupriavidus sp.]MCA3205527.1 cellulose biosynthesis cyclic di-GMP-binding regulatory protein BcsB [Cupriavidus sp.]MCA3209220.1 cellulose biosynthesis cyclic di-GMP-binding regulatory protein BcsB [Cupriav
MTELVSGLLRGCMRRAVVGSGFHLAVLLACLPAAVLTQEAAAQAASPAVSQAVSQAAAPAAAASDAVAAPPGRTQTLTFAQMGANYTIPLRGIDPDSTVNVGVRLDEVVTAARLKLVFTYSPSLVYPLSHLKIRLNDEVVATLPLDKEHAGQQISREIDLDPRFFTDFNRINVQMIAHYTLDHCEDPYHSSLWTDISPTSSLTLTKSTVTLPDNLALLPAPFFDRRDNRRVTVPFVLPANADPVTLRAAGVVASWLGALASYRELRFPVTRTAPADAHAIALVLPNAQPDGIRIDKIEGPTVSVVPNPANPSRKLLVLAGRTPQELEVAANAVVLGKAGMAGASAMVKTVDLGKPRRPYDAPAWAPVDRPVMFKELVTDPQQLQVSGASPDAIRVNLKVPADLFGWNDRAVPMNMKYRYTAPSTYNDSVLSIDVNDQLVRSYRLKPLTVQTDENLVSVPLLSGGSASVSNEILIPAFRVGSNNQMQFRFHIDSQKTGLCSSSAANVARAAVDPDSSIDFSGFRHHAALPNLAFFANSGYPFTRMADLADTAIVIPDAPTGIDQETLLTVLGHMGKWTGLPSLRVTVTPAKAIDSVKDRDLVIIGTGSAAQVLQQWGKSLPLLIERGKTEIALRDQRSHAWSNWLSGLDAENISPAGRAILTADGPLAALIGFESPYAERRSVVALTASADDRVRDVLDVLEDPGKVAQIRGDLTVIRQRDLEGLRLGDVYYVGNLPWYARLWMTMSTHPALLAIAGILAGLLVALTLFWALSRLAARRNGG